MKAAFLTALACLAALALVPGRAAAVPCAPPGNSEVDQYYEAIPGGNCNIPAPGCGSANAGHRDLSPSEVRQLTSEGPAGRAVIGSVFSYAPPIPRAKPSTAPTASGESPLVALLRLMVAGSGTGTTTGAARASCASGSVTGTGLFLPIVLAVALIGAVVAVLVRRRQGQPSLA